MIQKLYRKLCYHDFIKRFWEIEYSEKIKRAAQGKSNVMNNNSMKNEMKYFLGRQSSMERTLSKKMFLLRVTPLQYSGNRISWFPPCIAANQDLRLVSVDIRAVFLHAKILEREVFVKSLEDKQTRSFLEV